MVSRHAKENPTREVCAEMVGLSSPVLSVAFEIPFLASGLQAPLCMPWGLFASCFGIGYRNSKAVHVEEKRWGPKQGVKATR